MEWHRKGFSVVTTEYKPREAAADELAVKSTESKEGNKLPQEKKDGLG